MRRAVALGVVTMLLSGLTAIAGSPDAAAVEATPFEVTADDGTVLRGHVYLPEGDGPFATVLEFSPYWGTNGGNYPRTDQLAAGDSLARWHGPIFDAGYAVAAVNVRGTDRSEGCLQWGTQVDGTDGAAVVQALASQPWSNGSVGMIGHSYPSWMAYLTLAEAPEALDAIAISSGIIDPWNLMTRNGATFALGWATPALSAALTVGVAGLPQPTVFDTHPSHLACPNYATDAPASVELLPDGDRTQYWQDADLRPRIDGTDVPVLVANGLRQEGHMLQFEGLWDLLGAEKRLVLGQWNHQWPSGGNNPAYIEWAGMVNDWFDEHLRGGTEVVADGVAQYQDDSGAWHEAAQWPPASTVQTLPLSHGQIVAADGTVVAGEQSFFSMDYDPVPAACPHRQALFVSPPLAEDVVIAGNFDLDLTLTSTLPDGNLAALLFHTDGLTACPDPIVPSINPTNPTQWIFDRYLMSDGEVRRAMTDLRHAGGLEQGRLFPVGERTPVTLHSHPFATRLRAGERLILAVGGGARELFPDVRKPVLTVSTGEGLAGAIHLPVIEGTVRFAG